MVIEVKRGRESGEVSIRIANEVDKNLSYTREVANYNGWYVWLYDG